MRVELDHELLAVGADAEDEVAAEVVGRADARRAVQRVPPHQRVCAHVRACRVGAMRFATDGKDERRRLRSGGRGVE